ncbi:superfamily I DNA/RNA helicase [Thermobifida halotolerans]|nr:UvrD-helicase domain-containing protein [Thermobifida halotolerans]
MHAGNHDYILVAVRPRQDVYDRLDRFCPRINQVTGAIEFVEVIDSVTAEDAPASPAPPPSPAPLLAACTAEQLRELGVAEPLIPLALHVSTEEELYGLVEYAPALTEEVLLALADGRTHEEVLEQVTRPVAAPEPVDTADYATALTRPATRVTTEDVDLQEAVEDTFSRWRVFLHPSQRALVRRRHRGPARVSGGPGTGKTIVALHRVAHLVDRLPPGDDRPVLLTTFNRNLAADLRERLLELGGRQVVDRVDVTNVDQLASQIVAEATPDGQRRRIGDDRAVREWRDMLDELGETAWDAEFLHAEWSQVILGQAVTTRADYFRARRAGRGRRISRAQRAQIWQLAERFAMRLDEKGLWTHRQVAETAARLQAERAEHGEFRYRHVVVDEAQDLAPAHWRLLRALVPEGTDDMFLVGDTHQRIYDNYVSLGALGINIRGRSARLTLSYRTTRQILRSALGLLGEESWDDLDDATDTLAGYRSLLSGPVPEFRPAPTWEEELDALVAQVRAWLEEAGQDSRDAAVAVAAPTRDLVSRVEQRLDEEGIRAAAIGPDGPKADDAVHVGTLHRFKGLEYRSVAVVGVAAGLVPPPHVERLRDGDPLRHRREVQRSRSLLFVAATRARDHLVFSWHGDPSPFLPRA